MIDRSSSDGRSEVFRFRNARLFAITIRDLEVRGVWPGICLQSKDQIVAYFFDEQGKSLAFVLDLAAVAPALVEAAPDWTSSSPVGLPVDAPSLATRVLSGTSLEQALYYPAANPDWDRAMTNISRVMHIL